MKSYTLILAGLSALVAAGPMVDTEARSTDSKSIAARQNLQASKQQACQGYPDSSSCDYQWSDCERYLKQVGRYNGKDMQHCMAENRPRVIEGHHKRNVGWQTLCASSGYSKTCQDRYWYCSIDLENADRLNDENLEDCIAQYLDRK